MKKKSGIILWSGKSLFDGERIIIIATGMFLKSANIKTGNMIQTYIMRRDIHPMLARRLGEDKSICGDCKHRENSTCYVNLTHGPGKIFNAFHDNRYRNYEDDDIKYFRDNYIRIGSYGDPAAVPTEVWKNICNNSKAFNGYTHQWKNCDQKLKNYCMASVDSIKGYTKEYHLARQLGWRTFRIRENSDNPLLENEFVCPASKENGAKTTCKKCNSCSGLSKDTKKNPTIILHGDSDTLGNWRNKRYVKMMKKIKNKKGWRRDYKSERKQFKKICTF